MLDMGFIRDIRQVLALLPARRQNLLFSATFSREIRSLAEGLLDRPASVQVDAREHRRRARRAGRPPGRPRAQARAADAPRADARQSTRRSSSPGPSTAPTGLPSSSTATASPPRRSTATSRSPSACARWPTSRPGASCCSWPPRSPRAAWTSRRCRTSSTSSCRWSRRLCPPHRSHRPRRHHRDRGLAGLRRRGAAASRRRAPARRADPLDRRSRASSRTPPSARSRSACGPASTPAGAVASQRAERVPPIGAGFGSAGTVAVALDGRSATSAARSGGRTPRPASPARRWCSP